MGGMMPLTDKSRYFRLAAANYERAEAAENPKLKAKFTEIAGQYRDLALEIDDAESRRAAVIASARAKHKKITFRPGPSTSHLSASALSLFPEHRSRFSVRSRQLQRMTSPAEANPLRKAGLVWTTVTSACPNVCPSLNVLLPARRRRHSVLGNHARRRIANSLWQQCVPTRRRERRAGTGHDATG
jgi:hypothetical protein